MCVIERSVLVMTQGPNAFGQISITFLFIFSRFSLRNGYLKNSNSQRIINIITPTVKRWSFSCMVLTEVAFKG